MLRRAQRSAMRRQQWPTKSLRWSAKTQEERGRPALWVREARRPLCLPSAWLPPSSSSPPIPGTTPLCLIHPPLQTVAGLRRWSPTAPSGYRSAKASSQRAGGTGAAQIRYFLPASGCHNSVLQSSGSPARRRPPKLHSRDLSSSSLSHNTRITPLPRRCHVTAASTRCRRCAVPASPPPASTGNSLPCSSSSSSISRPPQPSSHFKQSGR
mmetsp:Transcript_29445/g.83036  ORF Transcript_29445/g.83036 Transcript_29445/m.83036 type:complete len:211 (+) Transcript_29445:148-780(+)